MANDEMSGARRLDPGTLSALDLRKPDERIVWAKAAQASSEYSSSYRADGACGAPRFFPGGGDHKDAWCAANGDQDPWIEFTFADIGEAAALIVCETCGPGATYEARDMDTNKVLWTGKPRRYEETREAKLLHIPLTGPAPKRIRLTVAPYAFEREFKQIDAVALLTAPLEKLLEDAKNDPALTHVRFAPGYEGIEDLRRDTRIKWAKTANASSEYSSSYAAKDAVGRPKVYPRGGDHDRTWLPAGDKADEWLEVTFEGEGPIYGVLVFETCAAGSVIRISGENDLTLWSAAKVALPERKARMLYVRLDAIPMPRKLRIHLDDADDYREIDAVGVLTAPLSELEKKQAPLKPVKIELSEFEGTLAEDTDFVHAVVRTESNVHARTSGGPLRLLLGAGEHVQLDVEAATLYGPPRFRERGTATDLREIPWLAACLTGLELPEDGEIVIQGRRLRGAAPVVVRGTPLQAEQRGGYRDADRAPGKLKATAIATAEAREKLAQHSLGAFDFEAKRLAKRVPHPLTRTVVGLWATFAVGAAGLVLLAILGESLFGVWGALLAIVAATGGIFGLEFWGRMCPIPAFLNGPRLGLSDRRVGYKSSTLVLLVAILVVLPSLVFVVFTIGAILEVPNESVLPFSVFGAFSFYAFIRFALWTRGQAGALRHALAVLLAGAYKHTPSVGEKTERVRLTGTLTTRTPFVRTEVYLTKSEHLGKYTETDDDGNTVTRDRYRSWCERHIHSTAPIALEVLLPDGTELVARGLHMKTTHLGLVDQPSRRNGGAYAHFESRHEEGDEVIVVGVAREVDGRLELDPEQPSLLVFGSLSTLRNRVFLQFFVLLSLASVGLGLALLAGQLLPAG